MVNATGIAVVDGDVESVGLKEGDADLLPFLFILDLLLSLVTFDSARPTVPPVSGIAVDGDVESVGLKEGDADLLPFLLILDLLLFLSLSPFLLSFLLIFDSARPTVPSVSGIAVDGDVESVGLKEGDADLLPFLPNLDLLLFLSLSPFLLSFLPIFDSIRPTVPPVSVIAVDGDVESVELKEGDADLLPFLLILDLFLSLSPFLLSFLLIFDSASPVPLPPDKVSASFCKFALLTLLPKSFKFLSDFSPNNSSCNSANSNVFIDSRCVAFPLL